jgi:3-hydroxyisobutyrate dehydrogenase
MRVGFIGIGNMGAPMAANIATAGHKLTVCDLNPDTVARFVAEHGGLAATSLAQVADSDFVVTMLPTSAIVRQVLVEADSGAFLKALEPGTIIIDMSSSDPVATRSLGSILAGRGARLIDAPVSGGVARAKTGMLAIMIGGDDPAAIEAATPLLRTMGDRLFMTGPLGSGHAMKALNNFVAAASYTAAEALLIGCKFGLDAGNMIDILNASTGRNVNTELFMKDHVVGRRFATGFTLGLLAKDVGIAAGLGEAAALDMPLTRLIGERYRLAVERLGADKDNSAAILAWGGNGREEDAG